MNSSPSVVTGKVVCEQCIWLRVAPWQTKQTGCYHPENMPSKQKERSLDEQQIPGDHRVINRRGDCPRFEHKPKPPSLWERLWK